MKRILCIVSNLNAGGAETFLMKLHGNIDTDNYQMDYCVMSDTVGVYEELVLSRGGRIFKAEMKSRNPVKCFMDIKRIVADNGYKYVLRVNEHSLSAIDLLAARFGGAKVLAMRSTNSTNLNKLHNFLHKAFIFLAKMIPNVKFAPSTDSAEYTFGKGCVDKGRAFVLNNGLDYDKYKFNPGSRARIRQEFNLDGCKVIGHVGRFVYQKNHEFLIDIFKEISKKDPDTRLVCVGIGGLEQKIREKVSSLGLSDKVVFAGRRNDVNEIMSAFDVVVLPSFCEGMPNVVVEAQASGLSCVIADTITPEANITDMVDYLSLDISPSVWAETVLDKINTAQRRDTCEDFERRGFHLNQVTDKFINSIFEGASTSDE